MTPPDIGLRLAWALLLAAGASGVAAEDAPGHSVARCASIPADRYQTGLFFNPDGMQTYYDRSRCFDDLAVELRDASLCDRVLERHAWWLDGSQVSPGACRRRVADQEHRDIEAARRLQPPQRLRQLVVERDNNGRDFSVRARTSGGDGRSLRLTLAVVDPGGHEHVIHADAQPMDDRPGEIRVFVPADRLAASGVPAGQPVRLRGSLERVLAGPDDRAIYRHAPAMPLRSVAETTFVPASLRRVVQRY